MCTVTMICNTSMYQLKMHIVNRSHKRSVYWKMEFRSKRKGNFPLYTYRFVEFSVRILNLSHIPFFWDATIRRGLNCVWLFEEISRFLKGSNSMKNEDLEPSKMRGIGFFETSVAIYPATQPYCPKYRNSQLNSILRNVRFTYLLRIWLLLLF
jgi:hypothetical protein